MLLATPGVLAMITVAQATTPAAPARSPEQLQADVPPPTAYDVDPSQDNARPLPGLGSTSSMLAQLWRTVMALGLVVGLILLGSKLVLPKLLGKAMTPTSKHIKVLERTVVDGRNALVLVEIGAGSRILLGSSETGLRLVAHVATPPATTFESSMGPAGTMLTSQGSRDAQTN